MQKKARLLSTIGVREGPNDQLSSVPIDRQKEWVSVPGMYILEVRLGFQSEWKPLDIVFAAVQRGFFCHRKKSPLRDLIENFLPKLCLILLGSMLDGIILDISQLDKIWLISNKCYCFSKREKKPPIQSNCSYGKTMHLCSFTISASYVCVCKHRLGSKVTA